MPGYHKNSFLKFRTFRSLYMITTMTETFDIFYHLRPQKSHNVFMLDLPVSGTPQKGRNLLDPLDRAPGNPRDSAYPAFDTAWVSYSLGGMILSQLESFVITISVIKYPRNIATNS